MATPKREDPVRIWAAEAGYTVAGKGKIPYEIVNAYNEAHGIETPDPPEPDPELFSRDELARDPDPKHDGKDSPRRPPRVTSTLRRDIRAKIAFAMMPPAVMFRRVDPYCGGELVAQVPDIADAFTDIVCDSADLIEFFSSTEGYMKWLKVMAALAPVAQTAWGHHFSHTIGNTENGQGAGPAANGFMPDADTDLYHAPAL